MLARWLASLLVLISLVAVPLAHAGEPDPPWDPGYDDRPADDAINTLVSAVAALDIHSIGAERLPVAPQFVEPVRPAPIPRVAGPHAAARAPASL